MRGPYALVVALALVAAGCATQPASPGDSEPPPETPIPPTPPSSPSPPSPPSDGGQVSEAPFPPAVALEPFVDGLAAPLLVTNAGDGSGRVFVVEQGGRILVVPAGTSAPEAYLDLSLRTRPGSERGLLGLAFAPDFAETGRLYASYTDENGDSKLERFTVDAPATGRPSTSTAELLLTQAQPFSNHNGGHVAFGPDGMLYLGWGDGGSAGDPHGNAQSLDTLLGKLLRLDVSGPAATAAEDNPFVGREGRDEIWAYGLRNPWRFSFDRATGDLFIGDVGQHAWEEVDHQPAVSGGGENYGWDRYEGDAAYESAGGRESLVFPILSYARTGGHCAVTGGHVYRGEAVPDLVGRYVFGDYCSGTVWVAQPTDDGWEKAVLLETEHRLSSFGEDEAGELYLVDHEGAVFRFVPG